MSATQIKRYYIYRHFTSSRPRDRDIVPPNTVTMNRPLGEAVLVIKRLSVMFLKQ